MPAMDDFMKKPKSYDTIMGNIEADLSHRRQAVDNWLKQHCAAKIGDIVFDNCAAIKEISKNRYMGFYIVLQPIEPEINIGSGYGESLTINF